MYPSSSTPGQSNRRALLASLALALGFAARAPLSASGAAASSEVDLAAGDRILVLAPHPDDEVIGCGGVIQRALKMGLPVHVAFLTYGDNNEWSFAVFRKHLVLEPSAVRKMGLIRHDEAIRADRVLGLSSNDLTFLGYPDFGTFYIWNDHWDQAPAFESMLTRVREVPYPNAYRPGAPYKGEEILRDLTAVIRDFRPTKVFLSHPADFHYDHRALYLFTRVALWNLEPELHPALYPYLVHFRKWPTIRGYRPGEPLVPPAFFQDLLGWQHLRLSAAEVEIKHRAIQQHTT